MTTVLINHPQLPMCDVCNKPVDRMERFEVDFEDKIRFRAFCHGEEQVVDISQRNIMNAHEIQITRAFQKDGLPVPIARITK